jgi:hypothetical protein
MKIAKLALILCSVTAPSIFASSYLVSIDTSSLPTSTGGFMDFLFNNGGGAFDPITASITDFTSPGATLNSATLSTQGTVAGLLPSPVSIDNDNAEYLEGLTFGTSLNFILQFTETPTGTGSGSTFTLSLLNSTLDGAFLTSDTNDGFILEFDIDNQGNVATTTFPTAAGGPSVVTITATTLPEPGTCAMCAAGVIGLALLRRKRN